MNVSVHDEVGQPAGVDVAVDEGAEVHSPASRVDDNTLISPKNHIYEGILPKPVAFH